MTAGNSGSQAGDPVKAGEIMIEIIRRVARAKGAATDDAAA